LLLTLIFHLRQDGDAALLDFPQRSFAIARIAAEFGIELAADIDLRDALAGL